MASSNKQITLLFILPLIIATVYSAPLDLQRCPQQNNDCGHESIPLQLMAQQLYCTSKSLNNTIINSNVVALPAENDVGPDDQQNINQTLQQFNLTCKEFTTVMAIKHQLQYSLFNGSYYFNSNGTQEQVTSEENVGKLISILQYIETIGSILQNIEKDITNKSCIVFSSDQFKKLYWHLPEVDNTSVINTLKYALIPWDLPRYYEWKKGNCTISVPTDCACNKSMNM